MRILFTDTIGAAVLHNGKIAPANRCSNFKPSPMPIGDEAFRQSDGAKTRFRYRDDFGCTFDLTGIPVKAAKTNLIEVNGDIVGTVGATPTGLTVTAPSTAVVALQRSGVAPGDIGYNALMALHTRDSTAANTIIGSFAQALTNGHHLVAAVWVYIPSGSTAAAVTFAWENNVGTVVTGTADLTKTNQWQQLTSTAIATATATGNPVLRMTGVTGSAVYSDLWSVTDTDDGLTTRMVDVADRLAYHLENGGQCQLDTGDYDGNSYATCGVLPGAKIQAPTLSDKRLLEYTLSLALVNLAGSPARMRCHYL
jgi:hypothetical protein